jgi:hypothetical protein
MIVSTNLTNEEFKKLKLEKRKEKLRVYHNNYYHDKTKNKIVYCSICDKHILRSSMKYHLEKSKEHQKNIIIFNNNNNE